MTHFSDPILAYEARVFKMIRDSLFPHPLSDCCRSPVIEVNDFDVCACCLQHCTPTPV